MSERKTFLVRFVDSDRYTADEIADSSQVRISPDGTYMEAESLFELGQSVGRQEPQAEFVFRFPEFQRKPRLIENMRLEFRNGFGKGLSSIDEEE